MKRTHTAVCRLAGDLLEVSNAITVIILRAAGPIWVAADLAWVRSPDQGTVEGHRDASGLETGSRNVLGVENLGSNDLEVSNDILDCTGDSVGAVSADGNLPLDVHHGVVAREALDGIFCKGRCLRLELVLISDCVPRRERSPRDATHSQRERYAHRGGDDQVDVFHDGWLLIGTGAVWLLTGVQVQKDCFKKVEGGSHKFYGSTRTLRR